MNEVKQAPDGAISEAAVLSVLKPAWVKLAALEDDYVRKCAVVGLMLNVVREQMALGEFGPWLHRNVFPEATIPPGKRVNDLPHWRRAHRWMEAGRNAAQLAQWGHVSPGAAVELANAILSGHKQPLSEETGIMRQQFVAAVEGKSLAQLTFRFDHGRPVGGDKLWGAFLRANHPELIKDGKVPPRGKAGKATKAVMGEFKTWVEAKIKPSGIKEKKEAARALLYQVQDVLSAAVKNPLLLVLESHELAPAAPVTKLWSDRLHALIGRKS